MKATQSQTARYNALTQTQRTAVGKELMQKMGYSLRSIYDYANGITPFPEAKGLDLFEQLLENPPAATEKKVAKDIDTMSQFEKFKLGGANCVWLRQVKNRQIMGI